MTVSILITIQNSKPQKQLVTNCTDNCVEIHDGHFILVDKII